MRTLIQSAVVLALLGGCSGTPIVASADVVVDASRACPIPFVAGSWQRVYAPSESRYLNDHTLVFDEQAARWHLYGITNTGPGMPQAEVSLLHATAPSLNGPWTDEEPILTADAALNERVLWAPHVFQEREGVGHTMVYYASDSSWTAASGVAEPGLRIATSSDFYQWDRVERSPDPAHRPVGGRDPFAFHLNDQWLLYSVSQSATGSDMLAHGRIIVTAAREPFVGATWSAPTVVLEDPEADYPWGNLESPFVVRTDCGYYLFITRTTHLSKFGDYARTLVFVSNDPMHFEWSPITEIHAHAAEIVEDHAGGTWITSAGWPAVVGEANRGLSIARLRWSEP